MPNKLTQPAEQGILDALRGSMFAGFDSRRVHVFGWDMSGAAPLRDTMMSVARSVATCPSASVTRNASGKRPPRRGTPRSVPSASRCRPGGSGPDVTRQLYGVIPLLATSCRRTDALREPLVSLNRSGGVDPGRVVAAKLA